MTLGNLHRIVVCTVAVAAIAAAGAPTRAGEPSPESQARDLAAEVMRETGDDGLGAWTRGVIDRALERAGEAASNSAADTAAGNGLEDPPVPLAAERQAARVGSGVGARPNTSEILVFMSLAVPPESWAQWAREAARTGVPLVLRGVGPAGFLATVKEVGERIGGTKAGVAIDPRLFRLFGVERVPAVIAVAGGVPPCASRGCAADPAPPHDLVTGNIGLAAALEAVAAEGSAGRAAARRYLERAAGDRR